MSDDPQPKPKKIIIDEDWKSQVQAEKEALEQSKKEPGTESAPLSEDPSSEGPPAEKPPAEKPPAEKPSAEKPSSEGPPPEGPSDEQLPPASFALLVSTLAAQAMAVLGQVPDPAEGKPIRRPNLARHYIDTLGMLEEKTRGNLDAQETEMLSSVLHQLRMLYVASQGATASSATTPGDAPPQST